MGWQDRDYARSTRQSDGPPMGGGIGALRPRTVTGTLIAVNIGVFMLCVFSARGSIETSPVFQFAAMESTLVQRGQIWRLLTCEYLHWTPMHLLFNMVGLYFFGRPIERLWGGRKFFAFYSVAGVVGSVFLTILTSAGWLGPTLAAGASGSVLGLLGASAFLFPQATVFILPIPFPIKIRVFSFVFGGLYLFNILQKGRNAGGDVCHLAGLIFGVWFAWRGDRWWRSRIAPRLSGLFGQFNTNRLPQSRFRDTVAQRRTDAATIDRILTKVRESGIASLSNQERQALSEATRREQLRDEQINQQSW